MYVARMCLFDRAANRFIGNILGLRPQAVINKDATWQFNPKVCASGSSARGLWFTALFVYWLATRSGMSWLDGCVEGLLLKYQ